MLDLNLNIGDILVAAGIVISGFLTLRSVRASQKALEIDIVEHNLSTRPWLAFHRSQKSASDSALETDRSDAIIIHFKNQGTVPAFNVEQYAFHSKEPQSETDPSIWRKIANTKDVGPSEIWKFKIKRDPNDRYFGFLITYQGLDKKIEPFRYEYRFEVKGTERQPSSLHKIT